jgi:hypothetical protein
VMTGCYAKYFDHHEVKLNQLIDTIKMKNFAIKVMSDVTNKLASAKQSKKPLDINKDETAKKYAYLVHLSNPTVLEGKIHNLPVEEANLHEKLTAIYEELRSEGVSDGDIDINMILSKVNIDNIRFDVLPEDACDVVIQGLDGETKMLSADLNECMMHINSKYEDRSQMTEQARQVLKEADELCKSIISKTGRN